MNLDRRPLARSLVRVSRTALPLLCVFACADAPQPENVAAGPQAPVEDQGIPEGGEGWQDDVAIPDPEVTPGEGGDHPHGNHDHAVGNARADEVRELTHRMMRAHGRQRDERDANRGQQRKEEVIAAARARHDAFDALARENPGEAIRLALPRDVRDQMDPEARELVEERRTITGRVESRCKFDGETTTCDSELVTDDNRRRAIRYAADELKLETGTVLSADAVVCHDVLAVDSGNNVQTQAVAGGGVLGAQRTLLFLLKFSGETCEPYTVEQARSALFDTTSAYFMEASYGQAWLEGTVFGWHTMSATRAEVDAGTANVTTLADAAATAAGVDLSQYPRRVYYYPTTSCSTGGYAGMGTVGGNPSRSWITGGFVLGVIAHEMGHNFGLWHANALDCPGAVTTGTCTHIEYGDTTDLMGQSTTQRHYNAFHKERLGWLGTPQSPSILQVTSDGSYAIDLVETAGAAPRALKVLQSTDPTTGRRTWYYVEFRQAVGFDATFAGNANVLNGTVFHTGSESSANSSYLLDMTPDTATGGSDFRDPALVAGASYTDATAALTFTTVSTNATTATVQVAFGEQPCIRNAPTIAVTPASQWLAAGATATYQVTVTSRDSTSCGVATFNLAASGPTGWPLTVSGQALDLAPGASGTVLAQLASPADAVGGVYTLSLQTAHAADPALAASTSASYGVNTPITVSAQTDKPDYSSNQSVLITGTVVASGQPVSGATVTFRVVRPAGGSTTTTATTNAQGVATTTYRLKRRQPVGTYQVFVDATHGTRTGSATTTFLVR